MSKMLDIIRWHRALCKMCQHERYMHNNLFTVTQLFFGACLMCLHHECSGFCDGQSGVYKHPYPAKEL